MIRWFNTISLDDISQVGGKNASLGELYQHMSTLGIKIPNGFAVTTAAYDRFVHFNRLGPYIEKKMETGRKSSFILKKIYSD